MKNNRIFFLALFLLGTVGNIFAMKSCGQITNWQTLEMKIRCAILGALVADELASLNVYVYNKQHTKPITAQDQIDQKRAQDLAKELQQRIGIHNFDDIQKYSGRFGKNVFPGYTSAGALTFLILGLELTKKPLMQQNYAEFMRALAIKLTTKRTPATIWQYPNLFPDKVSIESLNKFEKNPTSFYKKWNPYTWSYPRYGWDVGSTKDSWSAVARAYLFGALLFNKPQLAEIWAVNQAKLTNKNMESLAASAAIAIGLANAIRGCMLEEIINNMIIVAKRYDPTTAQLLRTAYEKAKKDNDAIFDLIKNETTDVSLGILNSPTRYAKQLSDEDIQKIWKAFDRTKEKLVKDHAYNASMQFYFSHIEPIMKKGHISSGILAQTVYIFALVGLLHKDESIRASHYESKTIELTSSNLIAFQLARYLSINLPVDNSVIAMLTGALSGAFYSNISENNNILTTLKKDLAKPRFETDQEYQPPVYTINNFAQQYLDIILEQLKKSTTK